MRLTSIGGKLFQLRRAAPSLWAPFIAGWLKRGRTGSVPCAVPGSRKLLRVPLKDFYESYGFFCEVPEGSREIGFFLSKLRPTEVLYDIGAFRGAYSTMTKTKLQSAVTIHAFEPLARNFEALDRICKWNHMENVTLVPMAVGDGTALTGNVNERDAMLRRGDPQAGSAETIFPAVTLDNYIARGNPAPTVMKIDVDGFELAVLGGGQKCLAQHRPRIWLEVHPGFLASQGKSQEDVLGLLRKAGYSVSRFEDADIPGAEISYHVWCE